MRGHSLAKLTEHDNSAADTIVHSMYIYVLLTQYVPIPLQSHIYLVCMCGHTYSNSMDQPGKGANPARGQLNKENGYISVRVCA